MRPGRPIATLVGLVALAMVGGAGAPSAGPSADAGVEPAPPPAYCRVRPAPVWPAFTAGGAAPDLTPFQDYRAGLGMRAADRGAGVTIADIEYEWRAGHIELTPRALPAGDRSGLPAEYRAAEHGTAVLGVLGASEDGRGVTGLVPDATLVPVSPRTSPYTPWVEVTEAAATLGPGDVILIELQAGLGRGGSGPYAPIEVYPEMRAAIRAAVDRGIVVVEPAGNGGDDIARLGEMAAPAATWLAGPSAPGHSGALIVAGGGAGTDETTADRRRVPGSNSGARVDLQGFGAGVVTAGYGDAPWSPAGNDSYTACFDGTSSAAATVAGAVAALQSAEVARDGTPLTPQRVRDLLVATGTPQADPADGWIGPRPSVSAAVAALGDTVPPTSPPTALVPPPRTGGAAPSAAAPPVPSGAGVLPASPAVSATAVATPAARTLRATLDRRARTLTLRLGALSRGAVVQVGTRTVRVTGGRVVLRGVRRGALVVRVTPPRRSAGSVRPVAWRVTVPARGAPRVAPLGLVS